MSTVDAAERLIVCPTCRSALNAVDPELLACAGCGLRYSIDSGIPNLLEPRVESTVRGGPARSAVEQEAISYFDRRYSEDAEPWNYTLRAGEVLRHEYTRTLAGELKPSYRRILDLGCSLGQLTGRMYGLAEEVHGIDVSPIAVHKARRHCERIAEAAERAGSSGLRTAYHFYQGSAVDVPVRDSSCDLILVCDGLRSWQLEAPQREAILEGVRRALTPDGLVILTDYLKRDRFDTFLGWIEESPLRIVQIEYLPDRQWYQFASWFNKVNHLTPVRRLLASTSVARGIMTGSRLLGRLGSAHMCVVATRSPDAPLA